jgi:hypothetical protein
MSRGKEHMSRWMPFVLVAVTLVVLGLLLLGMWLIMGIFQLSIFADFALAKDRSYAKER